VSLLDNIIGGKFFWLVNDWKNILSKAFTPLWRNESL